MHLKGRNPNRQDGYSRITTDSDSHITKAEHAAPTPLSCATDACNTSSPSVCVEAAGIPASHTSTPLQKSPAALNGAHRKKTSKTALDSAMASADASPMAFCLGYLTTSGFNTSKGDMASIHETCLGCSFNGLAVVPASDVTGCSQSGSSSHVLRAASAKYIRLMLQMYVQVVSHGWPTF